MTEDELEHWLWATKSVGNYVGVCVTEERNGYYGTMTMDRGY